jgi:DNA polymerase III subunit delta'
MPLPPLLGHAAARDVLGRAVGSDTLPQSILLHGAAGIGKERFGLWLAQRIVCEQAPPDAPEPCGSCTPCRLTENLGHPDVHWFFPLPRPDASSPEKLREKLEESRGAELEQRRADPLHVPEWERPASYFLAIVQTLQRLAGARPAMGTRKVFVIGDAERLVPQESSPEAANALLKVLEEPPPGTTLVLTAERAGALLPTVVSRVLPVRLARLPDEEVRAFLSTHTVLAEPDLARITAAAQGSIGRAIRMLPTEDGSGAFERTRDEARKLLEAALSESPAPRLAAALAAPPAGGRGTLLPVFDSLAEWLRDLSAVAAGAGDRVLNRDALDFLERCVATASPNPLRSATAVLRVQQARDAAEGNVNPQLILAELLRGLQSELRPDLVAAPTRPR